MVLSVPEAVEALVVRELLAAIATARHGNTVHPQNDNDRNGETAVGGVPLLRRLEPSAGLVEILADGTPVRRVMAGGGGAGGGVSGALVVLAGLVVVAVAMVILVFVWPSGGGRHASAGGSQRRAYDVVTARGAEAVAAADEEDAVTWGVGARSVTTNENDVGEGLDEELGEEGEEAEEERPLPAKAT